MLSIKIIVQLGLQNKLQNIGFRSYHNNFALKQTKILYLLGPIGPIYENKFNLCTYLMGVVLAKTENAYFLSRAISHKALARGVW